MKEESPTSHKAPKKSVFSGIVKWTLWLFGAILTTIFLLALLVFLLPRFVSTKWAKEKVELYATRVIHRSLNIQNLSWTWDRGILLEGLEIGDDPAFSDKPILTFKHFLLSINFRQLMERRLVVVAELDGAHVTLIRKKDGLTNLESLLSGISRSSEPAPDDPRKSSPAQTIPPPPLRDIQAQVNLNNISLQIDDLEKNRTFLLHNASFLLDVPSLAHKPIDLSFSAREEMDGKPLPPIRLTANIRDLIGNDSSINISGLSADIKGDFPGMKISVAGSASKMGIQAKLALDLEPLRNGVAPFLSSPPPEISGSMVLDLEASLDRTGSQERINYDLKMNGTALKASGGPLKEKAVGPLTFLVLNTGILSHNDGILDIHKGFIHVQNESDISFRGTIGGLKKPPLTADILADSISLNLQELFLLARAFVPAGIRLNNGRGEKSRPPKLEIKNATLTGTMPAGPNHLKWDRLELEMPFVESSLPGASAIGEGLHLKVGKGDVAMAAFFPTRAELTADLSMKAFHLKGKEDISLKGLHIPRFHLLAENLSPSPSAFFGITGKIDLAQALSFENLSVSEKVAVSRFLQSLNIHLTLPPSPSLSATTFALSTSSPSLSLKDLPSGPVETPFKMEMEIQGFELSKGDSYQLDMKEGKVAVSAGKIMEAHLKAHVVDSGLKKLQADGTVAIDLTKAFPLLPSSLRTSNLKGGKVGGKIDVTWNYNGRRPTPMEMERFMSKDVPLKEKLQSAGFVETAGIETRLTDIRLNIPFGEKGALNVDKINTPKPLKFSLENGLNKLAFKGNIVIEGIRSLPVSTKIGQPVQGVLSFSGALDNLEALKLSQNLEMEPLGLSQSLTTTLSGLDRFLGGADDTLTERALKKLRGSLEASLKATPGPGLSPYLQALSIQGLDVAGTVEAAVGVDFDGNGGMMGRARLKSPHLDVALKERLRIKGLKIDVDLEKKLRILSGKDTEHTDAPASPYLSVKVLDPLLSTQTIPGARSQISPNPFPKGDLRVSFARSPALAFDSLHMKMDPVPLDLTDFALHLHLADSLPVIDSFQFDVLGGTWVGDIALFRKGRGSDELFMVEMDGSFTGINTAKMAPKIEGTGPQGADTLARETELAGNISLRFPVSTDPDAAINNLSGVIRLTHIGSKTLERLLYAMDPYESNEMIRKQRTILRQGTPLWVTVEIRSGNLSLAGEVLVKGARITFPTIERFNISALPVRKRLEKAFSSLGPVVNALKALSANAILIDKGKIQLVNQ